MRPRALTRLLLLALLGTGCRRPLPEKGLPDALAAVVWLEDGELLSMLVELPRPGVEPTVRLAEGAVAVDKGWARAWLTRDLGQGRTRCTLMDLAGDATWSTEASGPLELWSLDRERAVVRAGDTVLEQPALPGAGARPLAELPGPGGALTHPGPVGGFALRVEQGRLEVRLPRTEGTAAWTALMHGVDHLVGSWWLVSTALPPWQRKVVDDRFKQVGVLHAADEPAVADGRLGEWRGSQALRVDHPSQILQGQASWSGERDGAFGVAARASGDQAVLAIRVRDNMVNAPYDQLVLRSGRSELFVPLDGHAGETRAGDWAAHRSRRRGWDQAVEVQLPASALGGMVVHLVDSDPGQQPTLMATAPYPALLARGAMALTPEGPSRPPPQ